ncbi:MAG: flagellar biosynthetic protein FliR [Sandaracinaceae bacterium]
MDRLVAAVLSGAAPDPALGLLVLARTLPVTMVAPWLGGRRVGLGPRLGIGLVLSIALMPLAASAAGRLPKGALALGALALREVAVGLTFAVATSVPLIALGWTGRLLDRFRGAGPEDRTLAELHLAAGVVLFVVIGAHRLGLQAFGEALVALPIGTPPADPEAFLVGSLRLVVAALTLTVAFAAPAALAFVTLEALGGLLARLAPRLAGAIEPLGPRAATALAVGLAGLAALLPRLGPAIREAIAAVERLW